MSRSALSVASCALAWLAALGASAGAQDLEPRRWTHLPVGLNIFSLGLAEAQADVSFNPVLQLTDVERDAHVQMASYFRSFDLAGRSARVDVRVPYQEARWEGKVAGEPDSLRRRGFDDPRIRLSVNLLGAPALAGPEFQAFREEHPVNTIVGAAVGLSLPLGQYHEDKLLNLGENRYTIQPQVGVLHTRGPWSFEVSASAYWFSENRDFFGDTRLKQKPLLEAQAHVVHTWPGGWWLALGSGYGWGGESSIDGEEKSDRREAVLSGLSLGVPLAPDQGLTLAYLRGRSRSDVGSDRDVLAAAWSVRF